MLISLPDDIIDKIYHLAHKMDFNKVLNEIETRGEKLKELTDNEGGFFTYFVKSNSYFILNQDKINYYNGIYIPDDEYNFKILYHYLSTDPYLKYVSLVS